MTLLLFSVLGERVVEATLPMMLFHCGGRRWGGNTASGIASLRRNGAAITSVPCDFTAALECGMMEGGSRADVIAYTTTQW